jgi:hypothetical protein
MLPCLDLHNHKEKFCNDLVNAQIGDHVFVARDAANSFVHRQAADDQNFSEFKGKYGEIDTLSIYWRILCPWNNDGEVSDIVDKTTLREENVI